MLFKNFVIRDSVEWNELVEWMGNYRKLTRETTTSFLNEQLQYELPGSMLQNGFVKYESR